MRKCEFAVGSPPVAHREKGGGWLGAAGFWYGSPRVRRLLGVAGVGPGRGGAGSGSGESDRKSQSRPLSALETPRKNPSRRVLAPIGCRKQVFTVFA